MRRMMLGSGVSHGKRKRGGDVLDCFEEEYPPWVYVFFELMSMQTLWDIYASQTKQRRRETMLTHRLRGAMCHSFVILCIRHVVLLN